MSLSGWCQAAPGARSKCRGCRWALCDCACHLTSANVSYKGGSNGRDVRESESTNKDGPGGALTPLTPGLADCEGVD